MLRKQDSLFLGVLLIFGVFILFYPSPLLIGVFIIVTLFGVFSILRKRSFAIEDIENQLKSTTKKVSKQGYANEEALRQILNAIPFPVVYINNKGDFEIENLNFNAMITKDITSVYDPKLEGPLRKILLDSFLNETQQVQSMNIQEVEYQVYAIPLYKKERYDGCILVFQDISRVKEGEKNQKRFIADASHELRTPISSIKGMIEILNRPDFEDEVTRQEFLTQIEKETGRLEKIVDDLLLQSKLQANKVHLEMSTFNLRQMLEGLVHELRKPIHRQDIEVVLNCPSDLMVYADHFRFRQVILNLFQNSINYLPSENPVIKISAKENRNGLTIEFSDNGSGMEPEVTERVFERFFRGESSRSRDKGGSGLGLAISKLIMEAHGGDIKVKSKVGEGTTFTLNLTKS